MLQAEESSVANSVPFEFTIKNPQLWWTWNLGTPALYNLRVDISLSDGGSASTLLDT
jgi:beta-galactosidase/beta-glucuronidase